MALSSSEFQKSILMIKLDGPVVREEVLDLFKAVEKFLRSPNVPVAFVVDLQTTTADGATNKLRQAVTEVLAIHTKPWGLCAGMAVITATECQDSFLRGVLASGPIPFPYRFFQNDGESVTWCRARLRAAGAANK